MFPDINAGCIFYILVQNCTTIRAANRVFVPFSILINRLIISIIRRRNGLLYNVSILVSVFVIGIQILKSNRVIISSFNPFIWCICYRHQLHVLWARGIPIQSKLCLRTQRREQILPFLRR